MNDSRSRRKPKIKPVNLAGIIPDPYRESKLMKLFVVVCRFVRRTLGGMVARQLTDGELVVTNTGQVVPVERAYDDFLADKERRHYEALAAEDDELRIEGEM